MSLKIALLKLLPHLPDASKLMAILQIILLEHSPVALHNDDKWRGYIRLWTQGRYPIILHHSILLSVSWITITALHLLIHWGRVMLICVSNLIIIGSDNGLSPDWRQAIISTNAGILLIGPLWTNFSEILIKFHTFSFMKMHLKTSVKRHPFCLSLNLLSNTWHSNVSCHYDITCKEEASLQFN